MRYLLACVLALVMIVAGTRDTQARGCAAGIVRVDDMAGWYLADDMPLRVDIAPCGGVMVTWDNQSGRHAAAYGVISRLDGSFLIAQGLAPDAYGYLDNQTSIGIKPAEVGWIQAITISPYGTDIRIYRLRKML